MAVWGETESKSRAVEGKEKDREERIVCGQGPAGQAASWALGHGRALFFLVTWHGRADVSGRVDGVPSWLRCHWWTAAAEQLCLCPGTP